MKTLKAFFTLILLLFQLIGAGHSSLSDTKVIGVVGEITYSEKKMIGTWICTWYPWCLAHNTTDDWSAPGHSLFTPEKGSYSCKDPDWIEYTIHKLEEAGFDFVFVDIGGWAKEILHVGLWEDKIESLGSGLKVGAWWGGMLGTIPHGIRDAVQTLKSDGYFDRPSYFKWNGKPVVSGFAWYQYQQDDISGYFREWVEAKQVHPDVTFWINGWHPNYWNSIVNGYVEGAFVFNPLRPATSNDTENQVAYYNLCEQISLKTHIFTVTPGFDDTAIGRERTLDRRNGQTYTECWDAIKDLQPQPDVVMVLTWNDHWECHAIEPIIASRSPTTDAYGNLYVELTRQYGSAWKNTP